MTNTFVSRLSRIGYLFYLMYNHNNDWKLCRPIIQSIVISTSLHQICMSTSLNYLSHIKYTYQITGRKCWKTMCNDNKCSIRIIIVHLFDCFLDNLKVKENIILSKTDLNRNKTYLFIKWIHSACYFIQYENFWLSKKSSSNSNALFFSTW